MLIESEHEVNEGKDIIRIWDPSEDDIRHLIIIPGDVRYRSSVGDDPFVTYKAGHRFISLSENKKIRENLAALD